MKTYTFYKADKIESVESTDLPGAWAILEKRIGSALGWKLGKCIKSP